jgi:hypothetical protein
VVEKKKSTPEGGKQQTGTPGAGGGAPAETSTETKRKPWVKKTPVEVVLEQIGKQEKKVEDLKTELKKEEGELRKLQQAKKVLEAAE